jgi:large subunit ribosomal protein L21
MVKRSWRRDMKYAILDSGGKQYIAREGETIEVDRLPLEIGKPVEFKEILLVADNGNVEIGTPTLKGATVKGRVLDQVKAAKIIVFKYVPKQRYRRKQGHRQRYTRVMIDTINFAKAASKKTEPKAEAKPKAEKKPTASKPAAKKPAAEKASTAKAAATGSGTSAAEKKAAPKKTATKSAATKKPVAKKPAAKKSTAKSTAKAPKKTTGSTTKKTPPKESSSDKKK